MYKYYSWLSFSFQQLRRKAVRRAPNAIRVKARARRHRPWLHTTNQIYRSKDSSSSHRAGPGGSEVGDGREFVPLHRLLAEVEVFQPQRDSAQEEVLSKRLSAEDAQLKLAQAQRVFAVAAVDELRRRRRRRKVSLRSDTWAGGGGA